MSNYLIPNLFQSILEVGKKTTKQINWGCAHTKYENIVSNAYKWLSIGLVKTKTKNSSFRLKFHCLLISLINVSTCFTYYQWCCIIHRENNCIFAPDFLQFLIEFSFLTFCLLLNTYDFKLLLKIVCLNG